MLVQTFHNNTSLSNTQQTDSGLKFPVSIMLNWSEQLCKSARYLSLLFISNINQAIEKLVRLNLQTILFLQQVCNQTADQTQSANQLFSFFIFYVILYCSFWNWLNSIFTKSFLIIHTTLWPPPLHSVLSVPSATHTLPAWAGPLWNSNGINSKSGHI